MKQKLINFFELTGLTWFIPIVRLCGGDDPKEQIQDLFRQVALPVTAMVSFFVLWAFFSTKIKTSSGSGTLDNAAIRAIRDWRFIPATNNGRPITSEVEIPLTFKIK